MITRNISSRILDALGDTRVVLLNGARQTGKSTLVQWISQQDSHRARYVTLDDVTILSAVSRDPVGFLSGVEGSVVIDEVQLAPGLFPAIKMQVDRNPTPGRFLLTGSADVLLLPNLAQSLVGRMEVLTLWPLSMGEKAGRRERFIDQAFAVERLPAHRRSCTRPQLFEYVCGGGFPEALARTESRRKDAWFASYITTILQRDVRDLADIDHLTLMPRLLALLASRTTALLNYSELARTLGLAQSTLKRYITLLETTFLVQFLPPWSANLGKRLVKSPKILLVDTGLAAHLLSIDAQNPLSSAHTTGPLLENFIVMELRKQATWNDTSVRLYHFRAQSGQEVDIVMEDRAGRIVAVEVKSSATAEFSDFNHLRYLGAMLGDRFVRGIVLYTGEETVSFAENLVAMPVTALWEC